MLLGSQNITVGDTRRYVVSYDQFLIKGAVLTTPVTVAVSAGATSAVGTGATAPALTVDEKGIIFWLTGGVLNEKFTVSIQVHDNNSEVVNDTIAFTVIAP
jgi:hypothetical protein